MCLPSENWWTACKPAIDLPRPYPLYGAVCIRDENAYILGMESQSRSPNLLERLRAAGLRPTRQRLALARLLFGGSERHVTAEQLHGEALAAEIPVSLATVYNTLHQF